MNYIETAIFGNDFLRTTGVLRKQSIRTKWADIEVTNDGHIRIGIHENAEVDLDAVKEINTAKNELADGKKNTVIFVTPIVGLITREAREYSASKEVYHNAVAKAIVAKSLSARLISNFFIKIQKPPAPTKLFPNETDAVNWLNRVSSNHSI